MSSRRPCNFHSKPGGCRHGDSCRFSHDGPGPGAGRGSATNNRGRGGVNRPSTPTPSAAPRGRAPYGACHTFWNTGRCQFEFDCKYNHVSSTGTSSASASASALTPTPLPPAAITLARGVGSDFVNHPQREFSPAEVQQHIRRYLTTTFSFEGSSAQMYSFLNLLTSAIASCTNWTLEDGQLLLNTIASDEGIGLRRLSEVFVYGEKEDYEVTTNAGSVLRKLSFQRGYVKLFVYYSSDFVLKSTLDHRVNALYSVLHNNSVAIMKTVRHCMEEVMRRNTFDEPSSTRNTTSGTTVFYSLVMTMLEYLTRYKHAVSEKPEVTAFVQLLGGWTRDWMERVLRTPPTFTDSATSMPKDALSFLLRDLGDQLEKLLQIVNRATRRPERPTATLVPRHALPNAGVLAFLRVHYVGPGTERPEGPRHDNDFVDIVKIRIAPTHEELVCKLQPFLPANIPGAPHPLPSDSMERILDIQFRLLREELTAPMREAVQHVLDDLQQERRPKASKALRPQLHQILDNKGGRYRSDNVMFSVYTDATFVDITAGRRGLAAGIRFATPPGAARSSSARTRQNFWKTNSSKRLMQGGLVALVWKSRAHTTVHLGLITSSQDDIATSAQNSQDTVMVRVAFFDSATDMRVLEELHGGVSGGTKLVLETPVMYEAIRPFLEALCREPATMPFARYLVHNADGQLPDIKPPAYATRPGFSFDLTTLLKPPVEEGAKLDKLPMDASDPTSIQIARERMREESILDPSQSTALVDCLVREIAMVQGPPGTGKSFIGVQLLRVLLQSSGTSPILLIAFTNHALDHLLEAVLDAKITSSIVRLGARARASPKVAEYSLDNLELVDDDSRFGRSTREERRNFKDTQKKIEALAGKIARREVTAQELDRHLSAAWPEHHVSLQSPPAWIQFLFEASREGDDEGWRTAGRQAEPVPNDLFSFWAMCGDLGILVKSETGGKRQLETSANSQPQSQPRVANRFASLAQEPDSGIDDESWTTASEDQSSDGSEIEDAWLRLPPPPPPHESDEDRFPSSSRPPSPVASPAPVVQAKSDVELFFERFGMDVPTIPSTDRTLEELQGLHDNIWSLSETERRRLASFWRQDARDIFYETNIRQFDSLRKQLAELQQRHEALNAQTRLRLLQNKDIIGCTTTGAAKLAALLKGLAPKVVMVEEAGQVLEAHVLGSLVPSVQHLICIGDPMQLRPTLNNYSLSVDSRRGAELYKFDRSLMERLSQAGLPMSRLNVQRRMRPAIADLIRVPMLYPDLEDHPRVLEYPDVQGIAKNVFFMTHEHKEQGGGEESVSKHNTFEVDMIVDMVTYLVRQTPRYAEAGSIVVLCAYLGQLVRLREAFNGLFTVVIDERDQALLANEGEDDKSDEDALHQPLVERVQMSQRILLRTVDNFQGEEADVIILSLVRNAGELADESRTTIGFLKSINRTNVALSRARHGMYILGNSSNLSSHSALWATIVNKLDETDALGPALPIFCARHPDIGPRYASKPGDIPRLAPDGGCLFPCGERLGCGHACPHKCHPDGHAAVVCGQRCFRLCARQHPCNKLCSDACGDCRFPMRNVELPCGHIADTVPCFQMDDLSQRVCNSLVQKQLPNCEHSAMMTCSADPAQWVCKEACGMVVESCSHDCKFRCFECQPFGRTEGRHKPHTGCGRQLFCGHPCAEQCGTATTHICSTNCKYPCLQSCSHFSCRKTCGEATCEPCKEPCRWACPHYACGVPCGSACNRLPCDQPCYKVLICGHPCPSLCGEPCESGAQVCPQCAKPEDTDVVDYIMQRSLQEVDPSLGTLDELLITLTCGHVFTVETLDGHCRLNEYYKQDDGRWTRPALPQPGYKDPPTCPKCRAPVTSPRYGRVFKRANLDILERNVAGLMSRRVNALNASVATLDVHGILEQVPRIALQAESSGQKDVSLNEKANRMMHKKATSLIKQHGVDGVPVLAETLGTHMRRIFPISEVEHKQWMTVAGPLLRLYATSRQVFETRFAHVSAHEAAFASLYRAELDACRQDPQRIPQQPEQFALVHARIKIGHPQPRADTRFVTEALWRGIDIRFSLASVACKWMSSISEKFEGRKRVWAVYCHLIYQTCLADAERALLNSERAEAYRQVLRSHLLVMRAKVELFQFKVMMSLRRALKSEAREELLERARQCKLAAEEDVKTAIRTYRRTRERSAEDEQWINETFTGPSGHIMASWEEIDKQLRAGSFYQPVSLADKMNVVKAMGFTHTGHWYSCPNGHAYVITECGGAMEAAQCPECGAAIGGQSHTLDSTNRRADDMERLGQQIGAQASPFAWGRF